jgi:hypothetical protein
MKIDITLEHKDLINQIMAYLAMQGLKPAGEIRFIKKKTAKGKPQEYEIQISCEPGPIPPACPICHVPSGEPVAKAPMLDPSTRPLNDPDLEHLRDGPPMASDPVLDPELGESLEPPEGSGEDAAGQRVPSIQTLVAKSKAIEESAERRGKSRPSKPTLMSNESAKPPE